MKYYEIQYLLHNQSRLFSEPQKVIAKSSLEKSDILNRCEECGYTVIGCREFDPVPYEERFYC